MRIKGIEESNGSSVIKYAYRYGPGRRDIKKLTLTPNMFGYRRRSPVFRYADKVSNVVAVVDGPYVNGVSLGQTVYDFYDDDRRFGKIKRKGIYDASSPYNGNPSSPNTPNVLIEDYDYTMDGERVFASDFKTDFESPSALYYFQLHKNPAKQFAALYDLYYKKFDASQATYDKYYKPWFVALKTVTRTEKFSDGSSITSKDTYDYYQDGTGEGKIPTIDIYNRTMLGCYLLWKKKTEHPSLPGDVTTTYKYMYNAPGGPAGITYTPSEVYRCRQTSLMTDEKTSGNYAKESYMEYSNIYPQFYTFKRAFKVGYNGVTPIYWKLSEVQNYDFSNFKPNVYYMNKDFTTAINAYYNSVTGLISSETFGSRNNTYNYFATTRKINWSQGIDGLKNEISEYDEFMRPRTMKFQTSTTKPNGKTGVEYHYNLGSGANSIIQVPDIPDGGYTLKNTYNFNGDGQMTYGTKQGYLSFTNSYDEAGRMKFKRGAGERSMTSYTYRDKPVQEISSYKNLEWGQNVTTNMGSVSSLVYNEVIDEDGKRTREYKDGLGRVRIKSIYDDYGIERQTVYTYNSCGQVATITQPTGEQATFEYDRECRLIQKKGFGETGYHTYRYYPIVSGSYPVVNPNSPPSDPDYPCYDLMWLHTYPDGAMDIFDYTTTYKELSTVSRRKSGVTQMIRRLTYGSSGISLGKVTKEEQWVEKSNGTYGTTVMDVLTFDDYGRPKKVKYTNLNTTEDEIEYEYDGLDNVKKSTRKHKMPSTSVLDIVTDNEYDSYARMKSSKVRFGPTDTKQLNSLEYDEYGSLIKRNVGQYSGSTFLQKQDYKYNKRGWLTNINSFNECQNTIEPPVFDKEVTPIKKTQVDVISKQTDVILGKQTLMKVQLTTKLQIGATPVYSAMIPESTVLFDKGETTTTSGTDTARVIYYGEMDEWAIAGQLVQAMTGKVPTNTIDYYNQSSKMDSSNYLQNKIRDAVINLKDKTQPCSSGLKGGDLFAQELRYQNPNTSYPGYQAYYNGNISQNRWVSVGDQRIRSYSYTYNNTNQMLNGLYKEKGFQANDVPVREGLYDELVTYSHYNGVLDNVGNIKTLQRYAPTSAGGVKAMIDNLSYNYDGNRRLGTVYEGSDQSKGFKASQKTYTYDLAGNVLSDGSGLNPIQYNADNRPVKITTTSSGVVWNLYSPTGEKLGYESTKNGVTTAHYYIRGIEYENTTIKFINHEEGRYVINSMSGGVPTGRWEYVLRDHQGNARIHFSDVNGDGVVANSESPTVQEIYQKYGYYPFGMQYELDEHPTPNTQDNINPKMRYRYTGYEDIKEIGVDLYDAKARLYDPYIGRFYGVDPLAHKYPAFSPYVFCYNNPINVIDPDGREGIVVSGSPGDHKNRDHFLINGLDRAKAAQKHTQRKGEGVTWLVYNDKENGYTQKQIDDYTKKAAKSGITLKVVTSSDDIVDYVNDKNGGDSRTNDKVTSFYYVGHSTPGDLDVGYQGTGDDFEPDDFSSDAFSSGCHVNLVGGCRTAVPGVFEDSNVTQFSEILDSKSKVYGSDVRVYYPGGVVNDSKLVEKNKGTIVEKKGELPVKTP